jgi:hypothetical protein
MFDRLMPTTPLAPQRVTIDPVFGISQNPV